MSGNVSELDGLISYCYHDGKEKNLSLWKDACRYINISQLEALIFDLSVLKIEMGG